MIERKDGYTSLQDHADGTDQQRRKKVENPCEGCYYWGGMTKYVKSCNYYLITGQRRPCDCGENCTVRRDSSNVRRKSLHIREK